MGCRRNLMGLQPIQWDAGGADPLVRAGPPGPATSSIDKYQQQADVGVGRGPGGSPHFVFSTVRTRQTRVFASDDSPLVLCLFS
jgi:hypothetical protein